MVNNAQIINPARLPIDAQAKQRYHFIISPPVLAGTFF